MEAVKKMLDEFIDVINESNKQVVALEHRIKISEQMLDNSNKIISDFNDRVAKLENKIRIVSS